MIKEGDIVICKANHIFTNVFGEIKHIEGNFYKVVEYDILDKIVYISSEEKHSENIFGLWFNLENGLKYSEKDCFYDYFITLAEYRDIQMNELFND